MVIERLSPKESLYFLVSNRNKYVLKGNTQIYNVINSSVYKFHKWKCFFNSIWESDPRSKFCRNIIILHPIKFKAKKCLKKYNERHEVRLFVSLCDLRHLMISFPGNYNMIHCKHRGWLVLSSLGIVKLSYFFNVNHEIAIFITQVSNK